MVAARNRFPAPPSASSLASSMLTSMMPHRVYQPADWYWTVGDQSLNLVWSSASLSYVDANHHDYQQWCAAGNQATRIETYRSLLQVMQDTVQPQKLAKGVFLVSKKAKALNGRYALDSNVRAYLHVTRMAIMSGRPLPGGNDAFNYLDADGNHHMFTAEQFLAFAEAAEDYIYHWTQALLDNLMGNPRPYPDEKITIS
jgi:hypothetical protein